MEAVGNEVVIALSIPFLAVAYLVFINRNTIKEFYQRQFADDVRIEENQEERNRRLHQQNDDVCSICLSEPKKWRVSSTCGHSFCAECLFSLYEHEHSKIKCPLCRQEVNVMFKLFPTSDQTLQIEQKMKEYNRAFDDNRPFMRRLIELPYVLRQIRDFVFNVNFILFFMRSVHLLRVVFLVIGYVLMPFDLIPESLLGLIGYIDDLMIAVVIICFFVALAGIQYLRMTGQNQ